MTTHTSRSAVRPAIHARILRFRNALGLLGCIVALGVPASGTAAVIGFDVTDFSLGTVNADLGVTSVESISKPVTVSGTTLNLTATVSTTTGNLHAKTDGDDTNNGFGATQGDDNTFDGGDMLIVNLNVTAGVRSVVRDSTWVHFGNTTFDWVSGTGSASGVSVVSDGTIIPFPTSTDESVTLTGVTPLGSNGIRLLSFRFDVLRIVPEPTTMPMLSFGLLALARCASARRKASGK